MERKPAAQPNQEYRQIDDTWRAWIGENLLLGHAPQAIANILIQSGFRPQESGKEVNLAMQSPFLRSAERLINRNRKSEWLFKTYAKLNSLSKNPLEIDRRSRLDVDEFFENYYCRNRPVIITDMVDDWPAFQRWNLEYFRDKVGDKPVKVQYDRDKNPDYETESGKHVRTMSFGEYIDEIKRHSPTNNFYMTAQNTAANKEALKPLWRDLGQLPYLTKGEQEGMIWIGPAGTITPLHHDLTNNFMVQFMGRKQIDIMPSFDVVNVYNHLHVHSKVNPEAVDEAAFPLFKNATHIRCILQPKEVLFLPIGWWHYVKALDVSVTMTHTNFIRDNDFFSFYTANGKM